MHYCQLLHEFAGLLWDPPFQEKILRYLNALTWGNFSLFPQHSESNPLFSGRAFNILLFYYFQGKIIVHNNASERTKTKTINEKTHLLFSQFICTCFISAHCASFFFFLCFAAIYGHFSFSFLCSLLCEHFLIALIANKTYDTISVQQNMPEAEKLTWKASLTDLFRGVILLRVQFLFNSKSPTNNQPELAGVGSVKYLQTAELCF